MPDDYYEEVENKMNDKRICKLCQWRFNNHDVSIHVNTLEYGYHTKFPLKVAAVSRRSSENIATSSTGYPSTIPTLPWPKHPAK